MKKILSLFFAIVMIFTINQLDVFAESDITSPTVDKITLGTTTLKVGEKIVVTVDVSDVGTGVNYNSSANTLLLQHKQTTQGQFIFPNASSGNGKLQFEYAIPQSMLDGDWYISFISIYDKAGNKSKTVFYDASEYSFKIGGANSNISTPTNSPLEENNLTNSNGSVNKPKVIGVIKVIVNNTSITLKIGQTKKLNASVLPSNASDKKLAWTSSNKKVVTVDSIGNIKAISKGRATITAKSNNGVSSKIAVLVK